MHKLMIDDGKMKSILSELNIISDNLTYVIPKKNGFFDGAFGIIMFLLYYSKYTSDMDLEKKALCSIESIFDSAMEINSIKLGSGWVGINIALSFLREGSFLEIEEDLFQILDSQIKPFLHIENLLDASISSGIVGYGIYILNKNIRAKDNTDKEFNRNLFTQILQYAEHFFYSGMTSGTRAENSNYDFTKNEICYTYLPLLCDAKIVLGHSVQLESKIDQAVRQLIKFYKTAKKGGSVHLHNDLLFANSFYLASYYTKNEKLSSFADTIVKGARFVFKEPGTYDLSIKSGLSGTLNLYYRFYKSRQYQWLFGELSNILNVLLEELSFLRRNGGKIDNSFISGYAGIGISLLNLIFPCTIQWNLILGLGSMPPSNQT